MAGLLEVWREKAQKARLYLLSCGRTLRTDAKKTGKPEKGNRIGGKAQLAGRMARLGKKVIIPGIATLAGVVAAMVVLMIVNAALLRTPDTYPQAQQAQGKPGSGEVPGLAEPDYKAIAERNLFRAKLQIEIPKPKTEKEIEEETLTAVVKSMALKGVVLGGHGRESYAVIDLGGPKGVWVYEVGEIVENGLVLKDIKRDSVTVEKGDFAAVVKLFSSAFERLPAPPHVDTPGEAKPVIKAGPGGDIRREGSVTIISKSLAQKLKTDNNVIMSSIAVKPGSDGLRVVAVDQGSVAQKIGIAPNDTLQEVNGHRLNSSEDMNKIYEALKNATAFEVKVLRGGRTETLRYEIR